MTPRDTDWKLREAVEEFLEHKPGWLVYQTCSVQQRAGLAGANSTESYWEQALPLLDLKPQPGPAWTDIWLLAGPGP